MRTTAGKQADWGYLFLRRRFTSGRYLDPPEPKALYDFGKGSRATTQFDWRAGNNDSIKLLLMGSGTNFQQPNITDDQAVGRDAQRHLPVHRDISDGSTRFLRNAAAHFRLRTHEFRSGFADERPGHAIRRRRARSFTLGIKSDLSHSWRGHFFKAELTSSGCAKGKAFSSTAVVTQRFSLRSRVGARAGRPVSTCKTISRPFET